MSFLQLVLSLDKTIKEIILLWRICQFDRYRNIDHLFKNRKELPWGVFIDNEYSRSTEKERRLLRPVLNAARRLEKYKERCRLEGPHLVVEGKHYHRQNLHTLPVDLDTVASTSKSNDTA